MHHRTTLDLANDLPMLNLDAVLFEQALFNLIDNAAKYAPPGTTITIRSRREDGTVSLQVLDEGPGIPPTTSRISSTSSIARGKAIRCAPEPDWVSRSRAALSKSMQGTIAAANRADRTGAVFTIRLPIPARSMRVSEAA